MWNNPLPMECIHNELKKLKKKKFKKCQTFLCAIALQYINNMLQNDSLLDSGIKKKNFLIL